jgi:hypothetical protein
MKTYAVYKIITHINGTTSLTQMNEFEHKKSAYDFIRLQPLGEYVVLTVFSAGYSKGLEEFD